MSQITKLEMWRDVGFQKGSVEYPARIDTLHNPDILVEGGIRTSVSDLFSAVHLPIAYREAMNMSYLRVTYTFNADERTVNPLVLYGWVESVELRSDTEGNPSVVVSWSVDYWRTYLNKVRFGYGLVRNRPRGEDDPPQSLSPRYRLSGEYKAVVPDSSLNWLVFTYVKEESDGRVTRIRTCGVPVDRDNPDTEYYLRIGDVSVKVPTLAHLASGEFLTDYGISASQITSAFISPVSPFDIWKVEGTTVYPRTTAPSGGDRITETYDGGKLRSVVSVRADLSTPVIGSWGGNLYVTYSDGTSARVSVDSSSLPSVLVSSALCGVSPSKVTGNMALDGPSEGVYRFRLADLMDAVAPDVGFTVGDSVILGDEFQITGASAYESGGVVTATVSGSDVIGQPRIYTEAGWGDEVVTTRGPPHGFYTFTREGSVYKVAIERPTDTAYGYLYTMSQNLYEHPVDLEGAQTTDTSELVFTDMNGEPFGSGPWGLPLGSGTVRVIASPVSAYLQWRFHGTDSFADGVEFTCTLPSVNLASNSWVDYVYSGQREFDVRSREISAQQALAGGVTGALTGGVSTGVMGAIGGMSAGAVGAASFGIGALASVGGYVLDTHFNAQLQKAEDMRSAKQFDTVTVPSNGWDWLWHGRLPGVVTMVADDYALERFENDVRLNGVEVSEPTEDCSALVNRGGPLRIANLTVTGDAPAEARAFIRDVLADGVRVVVRNKTILGDAGPAS